MMKRIAKALRGKGHSVEGPDFWECDDYRWELFVDENVDISFKLCESEECDGEEGGVNFALDIVEVSGRIIGGLTPYNYSDSCWVNRKDKQAVEERFRILEQADENDIPLLLERAA
jgi:hypothetical protein